VTPGASHAVFGRPLPLFLFAFGVAVVQRFPILPPSIIGIFFLPLAGLLAWRFRQLAYPLMVAAGMLFAIVSGKAEMAGRLPMDLSGNTGDAVIRVEGLPEYTDATWQFEAHVLTSNDFPKLEGSRIKLAWYRTQQHLRPGDVWRMQLKLRAPNGVINPGGFDAEQRALQKHWSAQGYVRHAAQYLGCRLSVDGIRDSLSRRIVLSLSSEDARFIQALALGDTRNLSDDDWELLRKTGITHLIAISGFHVGIVALFAVYAVHAVYFLLPGIGLQLPRFHAAAWASVFAAAAYTALAGFAVPTVRTALMIAVFMGCRLLYRQSGIWHAVAMSMAVIVLFDPFAVLGAGFWLSFAGVMGLVFFMPEAESGFRLSGFIKAQCIVTLLLLPLTVVFFGQSTLIGPLVNLIAIPLISLLVVPLALLGCLFIPVPVCATSIWRLAAWLMQEFWHGLQFLQQQSITSIYLPEPAFWTVLLALLGAGLCALPRHFPGKWFGIVFFLPMCQPLQTQIPHGAMRVAMIDVGQGLSLLIRTRKHALLYDTGAGNSHGFSRGLSTIVPALRAESVDVLDKIIISHGDDDHAGGLAGVLANIPVRSVESSPGALEHSDALCRAGQHWQWDGVRFDVLWPRQPLAERSNDRSCVVQVRAHSGTLLLTGDIGHLTEMQLIEMYGKRLQSDILQVPHHGSKTSSSSEFIAAVNPAMAWVSSGFQSRFRHPNHQVIDRYSAQGARIYNSVDTGWLEFESSARGWILRREMREHDRRYWRYVTPEQAITGY